MKISKYIIGVLAFSGVITSCDTDNIGATYTPYAQNVSFEAAKAIDTTGAGDLWASGFLYGYMNGWDMERSGNLGSIVSNEVVQVMGAQIPEEGWQRIHAQM